MNQQIHKESSDSNAQSYEMPFWNPLIMRVLAAFVDSPNTVLFGITGDISDLGSFVALNGRARAENLVDLYNQYARNYFSRWKSSNYHPIIDLCVVPSGEELFLLGVSRNPTPVIDLFAKVNPEINEIVLNNQYLEPTQTSIAFGCALLQETDLIEKIEIMIRQIRNDKTFNPFPLYLQVMEQIRNILAQELDSEKFKTIINNDKMLAILFRNFVYAKLLEYKHSTRESLPKIKKLLSVSFGKDKIELLSEEYGLTDQKLALLQILIEDMKKEK